MEQVGQPVNGDCHKSRVAENYLVIAFGCWITFISSPDICVQQFFDCRQFLHNLQGNFMALFRTLGAGQVEPEAVMLEGGDYLAGKVFQKTCGFLAQVVLKVGLGQSRLGKISGKQDAPGLVDQLHH